MKIVTIIVVIALSLLLNQVKAQIAINNLGQVYNQNFDSLGTNEVTWTNEVTIPGWSYVHITNNVDAGSITNLVTSGGIGFPDAYNLGTAADADRALGSTANFGFEFFYGARFVNSTMATLTNVQVDYTGEQWASFDNFNDQLLFFYRVGGTNFSADSSNAGWIAVSNLNFPVLHNTALAILDGNQTTNRTTLNDNLSVTVSPGQEFWIRWAHQAPGHHRLGIDDLSITFNGTTNLINTNNPISPSNNVLEVTVELKKTTAKRLKFDGGSGFTIKGFLRFPTNSVTVEEVKYTAFKSNEFPTNIFFKNFQDFKILSRGKLLKKKGVNAIFRTKSGGISSIHFTKGNYPITLIVKVDGTQGTNTASAFFTNIFTDVKVK